MWCLCWGHLQEPKLLEGSTGKVLQCVDSKCPTKKCAFWAITLGVSTITTTLQTEVEARNLDHGVPAPPRPKTEAKRGILHLMSLFTIV